MSDELDFSGLFSEEDAAELARTFASVDAEDPEAAIRRQNAEWSADPRLSWRQALSTACVLEGVSYAWDPETGRTAIVLPGAHPILIPDGYINALMAQSSHPHAVACILKAVSIDPRFRGWQEDEYGDEDA